MNSKDIGNKIEKAITLLEGLEEDKLGFDASLNNRPIEIKGCRMRHSNGYSRKGTLKFTKGRFWIDNRKHELLANHNGIYIFVLYDTTPTDFVIIDYIMRMAQEVDAYITGGDNTKIRYDLLFSYISLGWLT